MTQQIDQRAYDNSRGHDEYVGLETVEVYDQGVAQAFESLGPHVRIVNRGGHVQTAIGQVVAELAAQLRTAFGQCPDGDLAG